MFFDPVNCVLDGVLLVAVKHLGLVPNFWNRAVNGSSQNDTDTGAILVAASQYAKAGNSTWAKVQDVSGLRKGGGRLPVDGIMGDEAYKSRDDIPGNLFPNVFASVCVIDGHAQHLAVNLDVLEIILNIRSSSCEILAVERRRDRQESVNEPDLSLREWDARLVKTGGSLNLSELEVETIQ
jgi:hypothetical protein